MTSGTDLTVILVNYNTAQLLPEAIGALRKSLANFSAQIIIVDNASKDNSVEVIRRDFSDCELIVNKINVGFGRANNQALSISTGRYILLLNTDAFVSENTVIKTLAYMDSHKSCGILGVKLVGRDGQAQPSARYFPTPLNLFLQRTGLGRFLPGVRTIDDMNWNQESARQCDWVPGCYYLVRKEVIDKVGLFDKRYFLYYEEVDHCFATKKAGWEVVCYPDTTVIHIGGESAKSEGKITSGGRQLETLQMESELLYFRKNHGIAGVLASVLLSSIGDAFVIIKRLLKPKQGVSVRALLSHIGLTWSLFWRTRLGTTPTR